MKRGVISPVFKYIFISVVGVIILFFFIRFAMQHAKTATTLTSTELAKTLDDNLNAFSIAESSNKDINLNIDVTVYFNKRKCNTISAEKEGFEVTHEKIIFSPKILSGDKIYTWTETWDYPFKIANFFYLSNPKTKYFIVGNNELAKELAGKLNPETNFYNIERIPERFNVELKQSATQALAGDKKYDSVKFIFIDTTPTITPSGNVKIVELTTNNCLEEGSDADCYGVVSFNGQESFFIGKPMLYGAIFADGFDNYKCNLDNALKRLNIITEIYIRKAEILRSKNPSCYKYSNVITNLNNLKNAMSMDNFNSVKDNLISNNMDLEGDANCVTLF